MLVRSGPDKDKRKEGSGDDALVGHAVLLSEATGQVVHVPRGVNLYWFGLRVV